MSPSGRPQRYVPARPRSELITAIAVGAGIVLGTALLVWLMRPGTRGVPGGGGLLSRQPRVTLLLLVALAAAGGVAAWVLRRAKAPRFGTVGTLALGTGAVAVLAVVAGIFWPGGVVRHWPSTAKNVPPPVPSSSVPATGATSATTTKTSTSVTSTTSGSSTTSAPASSTTTNGG